MLRRALIVWMVLMSAAVVWVSAQTYRPGFFSRLQLGTSGATRISTGTGSPEAAVTGAVGDIFLRTDGAAGTAFAYKASGTGNTGWDFPSSSSSTNTYTNKTYNAESTGNVLTVPFIHEWRTAVCDGASAYNTDGWSNAGSNFPTFACVTGSNTAYGAVGFTDDGSTVIYYQNRTMLPGDWTGAIDVEFVWNTTATSGNAIWGINTGCAAVGETVDPSFNAASTVTDAAQGSASRLNTATITGITTTGCAAGEMLFFRVQRDPGGSDTLGATANLVAMRMTIRRAM